ncbi:MAG: sn-glycerol-3-phosphate ABC transporter ATP-binding protein UgpC [Gammaproteobacteria bacterium]|nr:sn-glycerol-3-phosphate ABC transporter ATP-binding protein UgpC [Gammaproteobacteria bacterium]
MASVSIRTVKKNFGEVPILHGVDIEIKDGSFTVLVGPSGCGKSTLLRMIAGLEEISGGEIHIGDRQVNDLPPKERDIAMVFQNYALYPHMTVGENMAFSLTLAKRPQEEIDKKVARAADILALGSLLERYPRQLSGGQRQRVAMGRAIVRDPQVFLFDEPLSNLDAKLRVAMRSEIKELHQRLQTTSIYVTHDQIEAMTMGDQIVVMRDGRIEQTGSPLELYDFPSNQFVAGFMGSPPMNFVPCDVNEDGSLVIQNRGALVSLTVPQSDRLKGDGIQKVILGLRPEMITEPKPERAGEWIVNMTMDFDVTEPMGADTIAIGEWNDVEVLARLSPEAGLNAGENTSIQIDVSKVCLFDPTSGERVR